jgi:hypothetical protein
MIFAIRILHQHDEYGSFRPLTGRHEGCSNQEIVYQKFKEIMAAGR